MALPLHVEGKRLKVKHTKHFQLCRRLMGSPLPFQAWEAQWMEILAMKTETPSQVQAQTGGTDWWHSLVTPVQCTDTSSHKCPVQSGWSHTVWTALPHLLFDCTEDSSSFGRDPCHPSAHSSTDTNYMRGIQDLICIFHIHQKCIKRHHVLFTFDIYTRLKMLQFPLLKKKKINFWLKSHCD